MVFGGGMLVVYVLIRNSAGSRAQNASETFLVLKSVTIDSLHMLKKGSESESAASALMSSRNFFAYGLALSCSVPLALIVSGAPISSSKVSLPNNTAISWAFGTWCFTTSCHHLILLTCSSVLVVASFQYFHTLLLGSALYLSPPILHALPFIIDLSNPVSFLSRVCTSSLLRQYDSSPDIAAENILIMNIILLTFHGAVECQNFPIWAQPVLIAMILYLISHLLP